MLNRSLVGSPTNYIEADLESKRKSQMKAERHKRRKLRKGFTKPITRNDLSPAFTSNTKVGRTLSTSVG